jgi:hypothetical protein
MTMAYEDLDPAFVLPENIADDRLRGLYEVIVQRLRHEARDLPMNTVQQLLIERIAAKPATWAASTTRPCRKTSTASGLP